MERIYSTERVRKACYAARIQCIKTAVEQGINVKADPQASPWMIAGVERMTANGDITVKDLVQIDEELMVY